MYTNIVVIAITYACISPLMLGWAAIGTGLFYLAIQCFIRDPYEGENSDDPVSEAAISEAVNFLASTLLSVSADGISSLFMIMHLKSRTGLKNMISESFCINLEERLPRGPLRLSSPVIEIKQKASWCYAAIKDGWIFRSKRVIISIPTTLRHNIVFSPKLPVAHKAPETASIGYYAKMVLGYSKPWWRLYGLSGAMESTK
ncbi:hypothetical protein B0H63DRAFT_529924 [Podospora didyma]|uniref:monoamine oxidase n=1 Tax=Podospora didyma TaxID=330526 RepID=A0AAE0JY86_9PEZI|nr:hypothetical protein B0H63DRAFT_529924 [Podospora didyma]